MSACMSGTRGSGVLSSTGDVLVRGVGGVCDMCMCLARGGVGILICHRTLQRLRHILSDSVDLEVIHCHPNLETRQGLLSQHFLSSYLAPLSSSEIYGGYLTSNRQ